MANKRRSREEPKEVDALVERLRDFIRLNYLTAAEVARQMGVKDTTVYDWLLGRARPAKPQRIAAFLDSLPRENGSGVMFPKPAKLFIRSLSYFWIRDLRWNSGVQARPFSIPCQYRTGRAQRLSNHME